MLLFSVREADFRDARLENTEARPWGTDEVVSSQQGLPDLPVPETPGPPAIRPQLQEWPPPSSPGSQTPRGSLDALMPSFLLANNSVLT